jgi:hypothetical protein
MYIPIAGVLFTVFRDFVTPPESPGSMEIKE